MNTKMIVAGLLGGVAFFLLGWLIWGMLLMDIMAQYSNTACQKPEAEMNMVYMVVANLLWGYVFAYILSNWNGAKTFSSGAVPGAIISIVIGVAFDLYTLALTTMMTSTTPIFYNIVANAVVGALVGGLVMWWLGRGDGGSRGATKPA
jgi:hypothetical protein